MMQYVKVNLAKTQEMSSKLDDHLERKRKKCINTYYYPY